MTDREALIRIGQLERKVAHLYEHLGIEEPRPEEGVSQGVRRLAAEGKTIEAIRLHRQESGLDLASATQQVQALGS